MLDYNLIVMEMLTATLFVVTSVATVVFVVDIFAFSKPFYAYKRHRAYWGANFITFIKRKPVFTPRIKRLIWFIRRFGFSVKVVGINHFEWMNTAYVPHKHQIILNPNVIMDVNTTNNDEHAILWALAHEFGHAFSHLTGKNCYSYGVGQKRICASKTETIKDEDQAWYLGHRCLAKLFPNDRDLFKNFRSLYELCMDSYLARHEEMELLNEKKKKKVDDENPFAS